MRRVLFSLAVAGAMLSLALGAFAATTNTNSSNTNATNSNAANTNTIAAPTLAILSPQEGQVITGDRVTVNLATSNLVFADYQTAAGAVPGQGHVHMWRDESNPTKQNAVKHTSSGAYIFDDVPSGNHTLTVELVDNTHGSFIPPVTKTVYFTTQGTEPVATTQATTTTRPDLTGLNTVLLVAILVILVVIAMTFWWYIMEKEERPMAKKK